MNWESIPAQSHTLSSGLRVVTIAMPHTHRIAINAQIAIGSRHESNANNGVSHFLEHMLYRGIPSHPTAHQQAVAFEELGGPLHASTAVDAGSLAISVPPENFSPTLSLFAEVFQHPQLDGIDLERGIVEEEILDGLDEVGESVDADDWIRQLVFRNHSLGMPITGTLDTLSGFDADGLLAHHADYYCGAASTIAIAGPLDPDAVFRQLDAAFAKQRSGQRQALGASPTAPGGRYRHVRHTASQTELRLGFLAPGIGHKSEPAVEMLLRILDDGLSTRLYQEICDKRGLCYDVSGHFEAYEDSGLVELAAESAHDRSPAVLETILGILDSLRQSGPTEAELRKARDRHRWEQLAMLDRPGAMAEHHAEYAQFREGVRLQSRHEELASLTPADIQNAAAFVFSANNMAGVSVGVQNAKQQEQLEKQLQSFV